jgi:nitrite reductase (NO-forming)
MKKLTDLNILTALLVILTIVLLSIAPFTIQLAPNRLAAQETPSVEAVAPDVVTTPAGASNASTAAPIPVAQAEVKTVEYTLRTKTGGEPVMAFVGVGGEIDGVVNPELQANLGDTVRVTIVNGDPVLHDFKVDEFNLYSGELTAAEQSVTLEFVANQAGEFEYYCSIPGHREIGMKGLLRVTGEVATGGATQAEQGYGEGGEAQNVNQTIAAPVAPAAADAVSIIRNPADVPPPVGDRGPQNIRIDMTAKEVNGKLADGTTYRYMTFDGQVPGPMIRVRVDDTIELHLHNEADSQLPHSIDFHAATGPGGGAVYAQTMPGQETMFTFKALQPGLYVYHCATASIGHHISSGMYGLILVEPEGGLPPVDHEFYMMQGELYTAQPFGTQGQLDFSHEKMLDEDAEYFTFNGAAGALTSDEHAMHTNVGDTVRVYFGVGGPNATSSFHLIGEIFDRVYDQASLTAPPLSDVQTTTVAPGGATVVEFTMDVPGRYIFVDHALSRLERGLAGFLYAEGEENPAIFHGEGTPDSSGH